MLVAFTVAVVLTFTLFIGLKMMKLFSNPIYNVNLFVYLIFIKHLKTNIGKYRIEQEHLDVIEEIHLTTLNSSLTASLSKIRATYDIYNSRCKLKDDAPVRRRTAAEVNTAVVASIEETIAECKHRFGWNDSIIVQPVIIIKIFGERRDALNKLDAKVDVEAV